MVKIALLGCGRISIKHAEILSKDFVKGAILVAVCDTDYKKAKMLGDKFNIPSYINYKEMISKENIDVVSILTPSGMHYKNAIEIANLKKHIIVEKPMALRLDDADEMIKACDYNNVKLFVVKQNRFNLPIQKLKE